MVEHLPDVPLEHSFDGIQEYDNRLPNWWLFTLYGSIVFSIGYWLFYVTFSVGHTQDESYRREIEEAAEVQIQREMGKEVTNESLLLMTQAPAQLEAGTQIFRQKCVQCHGPQAAGDLGPNLTDDFWLHGPEPLQIYNTVMNGVLDKGMQAWKDQLGPVRVRQVVSFVLTRKGLNVAGKPPQGKSTAEWDVENAALRAASPPKPAKDDPNAKPGPAPTPRDAQAPQKSGG